MSRSGSSVDIHIEFPAYSYSFDVRVESSSSVRDVKREITRTCTGEPRADGQRLISKGRILSDDERVADLWKSPEDARILHLSVHPSAWTSAPPSLPSSLSPAANSPSVPSRPVSSSFPIPRPISHRSPVLGAMPSSTVTALSYIVMKHQTALGVLMKAGPPPVNSSPAVIETDPYRSLAMDHLRRRGWSWPSILDEPYPPAGDPDDGVKYEHVIIEGLPYLSLTTPNATPSPVQQHALKVLSHTFQILTSPPPPPEPLYYVPPAHRPPFPIDPHTQLNEHLQRLGLPTIRLTPAQPNANLPANDANNIPAAPAPVVEVRAVPVRALMVPLIMLVLRTLLIMYFFSPTKRPVFALFLSAWIMYEAWHALRMVFVPRERRNGHGNENQDQAGNGNGNGQGMNVRNARAQRSHLQSFLASLANMNLRFEDAVLDDPRGDPPPTLVHRAKTFAGLLVLSLYPAVWEHRRAALRRREGRLRTEANTRDAARQLQEEVQETGERRDEAVRAQALLHAHEQRPAWVRSYVERILATEWPDEL
ncbi:hypothetical protein WOLCODRAFT_118646 [Wolfiporia cocos MD-104 SS10]|uniref:Ubiquitin-like domain-containing protein n=1 Tax=Wolfiporia cocos (strain MD-104) TaxID=742152 RepID=A0A2H3JX48_WOLCO|nr:hypothetical protein WOLCODRAFT_118646 [Wolfiporia cocos MD-104 SS10]